MKLTTIDETINRLTLARKLIEKLNSIQDEGYESPHLIGNDGSLLSFNLVYKSKYTLRLSPIYDVEFGVKLDGVYHVITNKSDIKHVRNEDKKFDYGMLISLINKFISYVEWREYVIDLLNNKSKGEWTEEVNRFVCEVKGKTFTVDARVYNLYGRDKSYLRKFSFDCNAKKFSFANLIREVNKAVEEVSVVTISISSVEDISTKLHTEDRINYTVHVVCYSLELYSEVLLHLREVGMYDKVVIEYRNEKFIYDSVNYLT